MKLKFPFVIDIAYNNVTTKYNPVTKTDDKFPPNWSAPITPMPDAVICKASENLGEDSTFFSNWTQLGEKGMPRGAYHFFRGGLFAGTSGAQARFFVNVLNKAGGIKNGDVLVLDSEEEGKMSATAIVDFLWNVENLLGNRPILYSRARLLNDLNLIKLSPAQKIYMKTTPTWVAGTYNDPNLVDNYAVPPTTFIPDQERYGRVVLWQYGLDVNPLGLVSGIPGGLDFDWVEPAFFAQWKALTQGREVPQTPPGSPTSPAPAPPGPETPPPPAWGVSEQGPEKTDKIVLEWK